MVTRLCLYSNPVSSHSRRDRESLILDTDNGQIEIMVTEINGKQVRLGVDAPAAGEHRSVGVARG